MPSLLAIALLLLMVVTGCRSNRPPAPLTPQDRNGPCYADKHCLPGFTCTGATRDSLGTCQQLCTENRDCGEGALCKAGTCQKDCAELNEKCSERRVCCFSDKNGDGTSDLSCSKDEAGDLRCLFPAP